MTRRGLIIHILLFAFCLALISDVILFTHIEEKTSNSTDTYTLNNTTNTNNNTTNNITTKHLSKTLSLDNKINIIEYSVNMQKDKP